MFHVKQVGSLRQPEINDISHLFDIDLKSFEVPWDIDVWRNVCENTEFNKLVVGDSPIGFIVWKQTKSTDIWRFAVKPDYRNKGIGTSLLKEVKVFAAKNNCHKIIIPVLENLCYTGIGCWLNKRGFKATGVIKGINEDSFNFELIC